MRHLGIKTKVLSGFMGMVALIALHDILGLIKKREGIALPYQSWKKSPIFMPFLILMGWALASMFRSAQSGEIFFLQRGGRRSTETNQDFHRHPARNRLCPLNILPPRVFKEAIFNSSKSFPICQVTAVLSCAQIFL